MAILASGSGSNAENLFNYFKDHKTIRLDCILANKPDAFVLERAKRLGVDSMVFNREQFKNSNYVVDLLKERGVDWIVLAGFLWLIPCNMIAAFANRIVNIHPALLPNYGGKGMYGMRVHEAVVANKETETGITIHYVNEKYDEGKIIFQAKCNVEKNDNADEVATKIHALEYEHFPRIIERCLLHK